MTTLEVAGLESSLAALNLGVPLPRIDSSDVKTKPLDIFRIYLADILGSLVDCSAEAAYKSIQWPNNIYNGDLAVILPRLVPGAKADEVAIDLAKKFPKDHPLFPLPFLEGVHFRIFLEAKSLARLALPFILDRKSEYGSDLAIGLQKATCPSEGRKKLVVEFSSPNITSELQGKHLRSTILGAFVSRFHENMGWNVTRINYLGDWGMPIALLKVGWDRFGNEAAYQADPVGHLLDVYHRINEQFQPEVTASKQARDEAVKKGHDEGEAQAEIEGQGIYAERNAAFRKLEDGDEEAVNFWLRVRNANIENYKTFYSQLGVSFDEYTGESQVNLKAMAEVEQMLKEKGISEESGGAWVIHMQKYGLRAGTAIIRNRNGGTTYLLRDLAVVLERSRKFEFDKMIIVAANDNNQHFIYLHHILKAIDMGELAEKVQHLKFSEVSKMADKLGKGYQPQAILSHCEDAMATTLEADPENASLFGNSSDNTKALSVAALLTHELSSRLTAAHSFDAVGMTAFKAGTGPTLQYWYTKLCSLLEDQDAKSDFSDEECESLINNEDDEDEANLLRVLVQYPEVTHATYQSLEPSAIVTYLNSVIEQLVECLSNGGDDKEENADETEKATEKNDKEHEDILKPGHIALYEATRIVLENGMRLLGLTPYTTSKAKRADTPIEG